MRLPKKWLAVLHHDQPVIREGRRFQMLGGSKRILAQQTEKEKEAARILEEVGPASKTVNYTGGGSDREVRAIGAAGVSQHLPYFT